MQTDTVVTLLFKWPTLFHVDPPFTSSRVHVFLNFTFDVQQFDYENEVRRHGFLRIHSACVQRYYTPLHRPCEVLSH